MNTSAPGLVSAATVRAHIELLHAQAARALDGAERPGVLQLVSIDPTDDSAIPTRFVIGQVERMVEAAIADANAGKNVYVEARTVAEGTRRRGTTADTRGVFAFVADSDADKGRAAALQVQPSLTIETSPGNFHHWIFLDRALTPNEAKPLGEAMRASVEGDADTGVITQPYRVAGTPNYPSPNKIKRGRTTVEPTRIIKSDGPIYTLDQLRAAFPPVAKGPSQQQDGPSRTGVHSDEVEALAAERGEDRSLQFFLAVKAAVEAGMGPDDLKEAFRRHPNGCASKYLQPRDRLRKQIEDCWQKVLSRQPRRPLVEPTYPDNRQPVAEARAAIAATLRAWFRAH